MASRPKRPRDQNQLAKMIVDLSVGEIVEKADSKNPAAVALGRLGGKRGGKNRMKSLTPDERKSLALRAAQARWSKRPKD